MNFRDSACEIGKKAETGTTLICSGRENNFLRERDCKLYGNAVYMIYEIL